MFDIYQSNQDDSARFVLGCAGERMVMCLGLNPSTASREKADTTVAKVAKVAKQSNYDGFVMVNLYPLRATITKTLPRSVDRGLYQANLTCLIETLARYQFQDIWAGWGQGIMLRSYFVDVLRAVVKHRQQLDTNWLQFGPLPLHGHPRHPSRLRYSWHFTNFDIDNYMERVVRDQ